MRLFSVVITALSACLIGSLVLFWGGKEGVAGGGVNAPNIVDLRQEPSMRHTDGVDAANRQIYAVQIQGSNLRVYVHVNDVPVFFKVLRDKASIDLSFNEWIKQGLNVIKIGAEKFDDNSPSTMSYRVYYQSPSQIVADDRLVLFSSPPELNLPVRMPIGIRVRTIPSLRVWQTEEIQFLREERGQLVDIINGFRSRLVEAVGRADDAFLSSYDRMIRDEINVAYGRPPEGRNVTLDRRRELARTFREEINAELIATEPLKASDLDFESVGGGRLIRVSRLDGEPLIKVKRGSLEFVIDKPIYGRVGGVWEMLRNDLPGQRTR